MSQQTKIVTSSKRIKGDVDATRFIDIEAVDEDSDIGGSTDYQSDDGK
jgi:hypothetical protein